MAKVVVHQIVDDLDGSDITDDEGGGRVSFALQGRSFEVDLSAQNLALLRAALQPFIDAAQEVGPGARGGETRATTSVKSRRSARAETGKQRAARKRGARPAAPSPTDPAGRREEIRQWARASGYSVADRGRIKDEIVAAFDAAR